MNDLIVFFDVCLFVLIVGFVTALAMDARRR